MSSINSYVSFIGPIEPLTREEEKELIIKAQAGNEPARAKLIRANILYVATIVNHYSYLDDAEELMAWGCMGLNKAISKFDVNSGYKLITYAKYCIQSFILENTKNKSVKCDTSLDDCFSSDSDNTLLDTIESGAWSNPEKELFSSELRNELDAFLSTLSERDATIIKAHCGYGYDKTLSFSKIGDLVGLTKGSVFEIEKKIKKSAQSNKNHSTLADYLVA